MNGCFSEGRNVGLQTYAISREKSVSHLQFSGSERREIHVCKEHFIAECIWHVVTFTRKFPHVTYDAKVTINLVKREVSLTLCLVNVYKSIDFSQIRI
jgi:hypothetical protein